MATIDRQRSKIIYPYERREKRDESLGEVQFVLVPSETVTFTSQSLGSGYIAGAIAQNQWSTSSVLFDGIRDWASSSYNSDLWSTGSNLEWSYSWWLRKAGVGTWQPASQTIIGRWNANTGNVWRVLGAQTVGRMAVFISINATDTGGTLAQILSPPTDEEWHHYTLCYSGTTGASSLALSQSILQLYIDGVNGGLSFNSSPMPSTSTLPPVPPNLTMGRGQSAAAVYFSSGGMDEVAYFNRKLSAGDAADVYNAGTPIDLRTITSVSASLKAYWAMGEGHTTNTIPNLVSGSALTLMNSSGSVPSGATGSIEARYTLSVP